jgi:hypothetical protein
MKTAAIYYSGEELEANNEAELSTRDTTTTVGSTSSSSRTGNSNSTSNTSSRIKKNVYSCGYNFDLHRVFQPDYKVGTLSHAATTDGASSPNHRNRRHRPNDILIYGMYGPCLAFGVSENADPTLAVDRLLSTFPGKVLVVNGEPILMVGEERKGDVVSGLRRRPGRIRSSNKNQYGNQITNCSINCTSDYAQTMDNGEYRSDDSNIHSVETALKKFRSRLFQLGPYPPLDRQQVSNVNSSRNGKGINDNEYDHHYNYDYDYLSMYNNHSLQVFHMALYMTKQFGPPPPETIIRSSLSFPAMSNLSMDAHDVVPSSSTSTVRKTHSEVWDWWTEPTKRRNNTGRYPAIAYFARNCVPHRQAAARLLSSILPVHYSAMGGCKVLSQTPDRTFAVKSVPPRDAFRTNYVTYHDYKYCLVMENTAQDGYITEKIVNAFLGGCMPIYYGTRQVYDIFHSESFIFYDIRQPQHALDLIQQLEADPAEYQRRLQKTPILKDGRRTMHLYFSLIRGSDIEGGGGSTETRNTTLVATSTPAATLSERIRNMMGIL